MGNQDVKQTVGQAYANVERGKTADGADAAAAVSRHFGYSDRELESVPGGANLGLGCGNPLALESAQPGAVVVDLGSGGGFDCLLAAQRVGPGGRVIGIDISPEMLTRARANAASGGFDNVEFLHGDLEDVPLPNGTADLVISNCVIGLIPNRLGVFQEAHRILTPGGRLAVSDTIVTAPLTDLPVDGPVAELGYVTAAGTPEEYVGLIEQAGFHDVAIVSLERMPPELAFEDEVRVALETDLGVPAAAIDAAANSMITLSVTARK